MNHFFQFKKFTVLQDKTAMKVTTDACLFGAWVVYLIKNEKLSIKNALDIGTGTGLLSLMLQQEIGANTDAVEIDTSASEQAKENFNDSTWKEKLTAHNVDVLNFVSRKKYDLVISNPPFFQGDLRSPNEKKNIAKHDVSLTLEQLAGAVDRLIDKDGYFAVLLPWERSDLFIELAAAKHLHVFHQASVKQAPAHHFFRKMLFLCRKKLEPVQSEIIIKGENGNYTTEFISLLKDYYLYL